MCSTSSGFLVFLSQLCLVFPTEYEEDKRREDEDQENSTPYPYSTYLADTELDCHEGELDMLRVLYTQSCVRVPARSGQVHIRKTNIFISGPRERKRVES